MKSKVAAIMIAIGGLVVILAGGAYASAAPTPPAVESMSPVGFHIVWGEGRAPTVTPFYGTAPDLATTTPDQASACNVLMDTPQKSGTTIYEDADALCTSDVYFVSGTDYIFRGLSSPSVVASQSRKADGNYVAWEPSGSCASSTWAYWAEIPNFTACSLVNGCYSYVATSNYAYYSC